MNKLLSKISVPNRSAPFFILASVAAAITGCHGVDMGTTLGQGQTSCDASLNAMQSQAGLMRTNLGVSSLPEGIYTHTSTEFYVTSALTTTSGGVTKVTSLSRIQYVTVPSNINPTNVNPPQSSSQSELKATSLALRCRESSGAFNPISEAITIPTSITRLKSGDIIDTSRTYNVMFTAKETSQVALMDGGTNPATPVSEYSYGLGRYWTPVTFAQRSADVYEFYGARTLSNNYTVYAKAVYRRTDLPANSP